MGDRKSGGGDGFPSGSDVELVQAIGAKMGCVITWSRMPWARIVRQIELGGIDAVAGAGKSPEREAFAHFSDAYWLARNVLFVRAGESGRFPQAALKDLIGTAFRLGAQREAVYSDEYVALRDQGRLRKNLTEVNDLDVGYKMLVGGRIDGFLDDDVAGAHLARSLGFGDKVEIHSMTISREDSFIMLSKASVSPERLAAFNAALAAIRADGTYDRIISRFRMAAKP